MRRGRLLSLIALGLLVFLLVSALLARVLSVDGAEQSAVTALIEAEARGDAGRMLDQIDGCRASDACRRRVAQNVQSLRHPGRVAIIQVQSSAGFSFTATTGTARVAWTVGSSLPIVQCVRVRRAGSALSGFRIQLLAITGKLKSDAVCPREV